MLKTTKQQKNRTSDSSSDYQNYELSKTWLLVFEYAQKLKYSPDFNTEVFDILKLNKILSSLFKK